MSAIKQTKKEFLDDFCEKYWGRLPKMSSSYHTEWALSEDHIFRTVVKSCSMADQFGVSIRFFANGTQVDKLDKVKHLFPVMADKNFKKYHERVLTELDEYTLVVNEPEIIDYELWRWCRDFLKPIYDRVGMNHLGVYNAIFIGNYGKTPFGVHFDPESVFHIPFVGPKQMRVWPVEYIAETPGLEYRKEYSDYLDASTLLKATPGGWVYWSKPYWHISESVSTDELSVSMALSLNEFADLTNNLTDLLNIDKASEKESLSTIDPVLVQHKFDSTDLQNTANTVPDEIYKTYRILQERFNDSEMKKMWLSLTTGFGFLRCPMARMQVELADDTLISVDAEYPAVYSEIDRGYLTVSANGLVADFPQNDSLIPVLDKINTGDVWRVEELLEDVTNENREIVRDMLSTLFTFRACEIHESITARQVVTI